jgi:hypothetical protein
MTVAPPPIAVGVFPDEEHSGLQRLLAALEEAFPVRFEGRRDGELRDLDAVLELGGRAQGEAAAAAGTPTLSLLIAEPGAPGAAVDNALGHDSRLDSRLRGAVLPDEHLGCVLDSGIALDSSGQTIVLASCRDQPTWIHAGTHQTALLAPAELGAEEALRERLCGGRSAALLPLVHFLRELTAPIRWQPPAARASLLFDDPNLHWPSYGFVKLDALGRHAQEHGYHAAMATVPLDGWFGHPAAVRAMVASQDALSLVVHGNDHFGGELGRLETEAEALALAAQARRRVEAFGRRTGVTVDRVMVPPHEECSRAVPGSLRRCGFEAVTMTRPFPWLAPPPRSWLSRPEGVGPLVGWRPVDVAAGLPVLLRHPFVGRSLPELVLRSFLDQPLILYGHQADLQEGLGVLASAAADVNRIGSPHWCSLGEICSSSYESRRDGSRLAVRPLTGRVCVDIPAGIEHLTVESADAGLGLPAERLIVDGQPRRLGEPLDVTPGGARVEVALRAGDELDIASVAAPRRQPLALPRRVLSEGRDRLQPLLARAR